MKAAVLGEIKSPLQIVDRPDLDPGPGEAVVELKSAAINRRDYWITQGMYPGIKLPIVLGSDGAGIVTRVGDAVSQDWIGKPVVIDPGTDWGEDAAAQSAAFTILGLPRDGTFASEVCVPASQLHPKPQHLDWNHAAALPLAGVTAWRAVFTQGLLQRGQTILITGIGGGVATFALQFAITAGANVWVTSSSPDKIKRAIEIGAKGGFNYKQAQWGKSLAEQAGAPELIIDSAGGAGYNTLIDLVAPGGRIVNYGATAGPPEKLDLFKLFWKQLQLVGSTMGSPGDFADMLDFVNQHRIEPIVDDVTRLDNVNQSLDKMRSSPQFGKYVLSIASP